MPACYAAVVAQSVLGFVVVTLESRVERERENIERERKRTCLKEERAESIYRENEFSAVQRERERESASSVCHCLSWPNGQWE